MEIPNILIYGAFFTGALGAGAYKGYCSSQGIALSTGVDPAITYGIPLVSAGICGMSEAAEGGKGGGTFQGIGELVGFASGSALGGLGALVCEGIGYGAGYLTGRLSS